MKKKLLTLMTLLVCAASGAWADSFTLNSDITTTNGTFPVVEAITAYSSYNTDQKLISIAKNGTFQFKNVNGYEITAITVEGVAHNNSAQTKTVTISDGTNSYSTGAVSWNARTSGESSNISQHAVSSAGSLLHAVNQIYTVSADYALGIRLAISYSTGSGSATGPTLSSCSPANNATGVATSGNITITFSENVTIKDASKFTLTGGAGTLSTGDATVENATVTIPYSGLANGTKYTLSTAAGAVTGSEADNAALSNIVFTTVLAAVTNKTWAKDDAAWNSYSGGAAVIDNLQVGTSVSGKSSAKTFSDGQTYTKAWSLGGSSSSNDEKNLHFKVAGKCKISVYAYPEGTGTRTIYIRKGAYNGTAIASQENGGTTDHFILMGNYRTDAEADIYIVAGSNWSVYAVKVEPLVETGTTVNPGVSDGTYYANNANATGITGSGVDEVTFEGIGTLAGTNMQSGAQQFTINETNYTAFKAAKNSIHVLTPVEGVTIKSVTLFASAIQDEKTVEIGTEGSTTTVTTTGTEYTTVNLSANGSGDYWFSVTSESTTYQALVVLKITYDRAENIDVTISSAGYATLYYGKKLAVPAGVTAYKASLNATNITLTDIGALIPANTGVILKGDAGKYNFLTTDADASGVDVSGNILVGTTSATTKAALGGTVYTLGQNNEGVVGLRNYTGTDIRAYSAYATSISAGAPSFLGFDFGTPSGISATLKNNEEIKNNNVFNLAGQRVMNPSKGLYIVNGRKVVLK